MKSFIVLFALIASCKALSYECQRQHDAAKDCVQAQQADEKARREEQKANTENCYLDNGCTISAPPSTGNRRPSTSNDRSCVEGVVEQVKAEVEYCMREQDPNFVFPPKPDFGGMEERFGGRPNCPSNEARFAAMNCIRAANPRQGGNDRRANNGQAPANRRGNNGQAGNRRSNGDQADRRQPGGQNGRPNFGGNQCFDSISAECKVEAEQDRAKICACANQVQQQQGEGFKAQLAQCSGGARGSRGFNPMPLIGQFCAGNGGSRRSFNPRGGSGGHVRNYRTGNRN